MRDPRHEPALGAESLASVLSRALVRSLVLSVGILLVLAVVGAFVAGAAGVWGAVLGAGLGIVFSAVTAISMILTRNLSVVSASGALMGSWLVKMVLVIVLVVIIKDLTFYQPQIFLAGVVLVALGTPIVEFATIRTARLSVFDEHPR